jgi:hypothetical protein
MGRTCRAHWEIRDAYKILVGKPEGNRPLGRSRHSLQDDIWETGVEDVH